MTYTYEIILDIFETSRTENGYVHYEDGRKRVTTENHFNYVTTVLVTREELLDCLKGTKGIVNIIGEFKDSPSIIELMKPYQDEISANKLKIEASMLKNSIIDKDGITYKVIEDSDDFKDDIYKEIRKEDEKMWYNGKTLDEVIEDSDDFHPDNSI